MYIYKFGYYSEMDSEFIELFHTDKYTQEKFEDIMADAIVLVLTDRRPGWTKNFYPAEGEISEFHREKAKEEAKKRFEKEIDYSEAYFEKKELAKSMDQSYMRFPSILYEVGEVLIDTYGFKKVEYEAEVRIYGFTQLVKEDNEPENDIITKMREKYSEKMSARKLLNTKQ
jgi:hypothetical protein